MLLSFPFFLLIFISNLFLGVFVFKKDIKNNINQIFGLLSLSISAWVLIDFFVDSTTIPAVALFFSKLVLIPPLFMAGLFLLFSLIFPVSNKPLTKECFYIFAPLLLLILLIPSEFLLKKIEIESWGTNFIYGKGYFFYSAYIVCCFFSAIFILIKKFFRSTALPRQQLLFVLLGFLFSGIVSIFTNIILPVYGLSNFSKLGPAVTLVLLLFIAYAILRHQFLDIEIIIKRSVVFTILVALVTATYAALVVSLGGVFQHLFGQEQLPIALLSGVLIAIGFRPLRELLTNFTDRYFFQKSYDYRQTLQTLSKTLSNEIELDKIVKLLMNAFLKTIKVKKAKIILLEQESGMFVCKRCVDQNCDVLSESSLANDSPLIRLLDSCRLLIPVEEVESIFRICAQKHSKRRKTSVSKLKTMLDTIKKEITELDAKLIVPMFHRGELSGFFALAEKLSEEGFSNTDKELLETIAYQAGTAIENAQLFSKEKERVKELTLLYNVSWGINSSLLTESFYDNILTIIKDALSVDRAVLSLIQESDHLKPVAVQADDINLADVEDILKHSSEGVFPSLIKQGMPVILQPDAFQQLALTEEEEKLFKLKTEVMIIPLIFKNRALGLLAVDNKYSQTPLSLLNQDVISSLASQIALAIENICLNRETIEAQKQAAHAERLAALGTMTAGFAHEIKNPMVALKTFTDLLPAKFQNKSFQEKYMEVVPIEIKRVNDLVEEMLTLSRTRKLTLLPLNIRDVINAVENLLKPEFKEHDIRFYLEAKSLPRVSGVKDQLKQVFLNLFRNAIDAMPQGGELRVSCAIQEEQRQLQVKVTDTGIGISEERIAHVFEPFYTTRHEGTGLGLSITHKIIDDHGGMISVESKIHQGTTFVVTLHLENK